MAQPYLEDLIKTALRTVLEVSIDTGDATGGSTTTLEDAAKSWVANIWVNMIIEIVAGTGKGQIRKITANTATVITVDPAFAAAPDTTSKYRIGFFGVVSGVVTVGDIAKWGGVTLTGRDISGDLRALTDDAIKGLMRSIGDVGAAPSNTPGNTVLRLLDEIMFQTTGIHDTLHFPDEPETWTTTPLGASATFTSPAKDFRYGRLSMAGAMGFADQPSAADGVRAELSLDMVNWDYVGAKTTASANVGVALSQEVVCRFIRFKWVNGATAQTVFRFGGRYYIG